MSIRQTVAAFCDEPGCDFFAYLRPDTTQKFHKLGEMGWTLITTDDDVLTFCPRHR